MGPIMEMFACLFMIGLSFLFHLIVYEDEWVEKWYWKVLGGGGIIFLCIAAIMGY
jgi:multisubunit Na+/H+ antiporter MnhB subunit|tara:strand:+ start:128 stop:292 length:165 start_codon:yes stop_codon:yes gene_type:complete